MSTTLPFPYAHTTRYFSKGIDSRGPYYRVEYLIANYADADAMVNALLGYRSVTGTTITSITPHQHPLSPNLWCMQAEVLDGLGGPALNTNGYPQYNGGALIRAEYRAPSFDFISQPQNSFDQTGLEPVLWATQELDFAAESVTIQNAVGFTYQAGPNNGKKCSVPVKIDIPQTTMLLTYERTPYLIMTAVRSLRKRVNTLTFLGASAGCVLFDNARTSRQFNDDGTICQKTQLVFIERDSAYPWNSYPARNSATFYAIADGLGNTPYQTADLTPLASL